MSEKIKIENFDMSEKIKILMTPEEVEFLISNLPKGSFLEWGSGGTTLELPKYFEKYVSIEHDIAWYQKIKALAPKNVKLHHVAPNWPYAPSSGKSGQFVILTAESGQFEAYVDFVDTLNEKFDGVLIDGRCRVRCAKKVFPYLKDDGTLFVHDYNRPYYKEIEKFYDKIGGVGSLAIFKKKRMPELPTDSLNYEVITEGVGRVMNIPGLTCEIGLRRGGGSKFIIDALVATGQQKVHIAIDPYGNIEYAATDTHTTRFNYTNDMRDDCLSNMYLYCRQKGISFIFFNLEDTEFFNRFADGVPVYNTAKTIETQYSFVHFDGPHAVFPLLLEVAFFHERTPTGAVFVFDDIERYDHNRIHTYLKLIGWEVFKKTPRKWAYFKK